MNDEFQMTNGGKDTGAQSSIRHSSFSFFNSIRWRLQLWYGVILVVLLTGFGVTAFQLMRGSTYRRVDDELRHRVDELSQLLRQPPRNRGPEGPQGGRPFNGPPENPLPDGPPRRRDFNFDAQGPREFHLPPRQAQLFDETDTNGFYFI